MNDARSFAWTGWVLVAGLAIGACEDEEIVVGGPAATAHTPGQAPAAPDTPAAPSPTAADPAAAAAAGEVPDGGVGDGGVAPLTFRDDDFVESENNRDPFRSFAKAFKSRPVATPQRAVLMSLTSIDDMRLIAIVTGDATPRAMLVDPSGVGHVVVRGDYIGRPEVVNTGGADGMPVTLNWRVDRIRPDEVVLAREDPTAPDRPPLTRLIPLNPDQNTTAIGGSGLDR